MNDFLKRIPLANGFQQDSVISTQKHREALGLIST